MGRQFSSVDGSVGMGGIGKAQNNPSCGLDADPCLTPDAETRGGAPAHLLECDDGHFYVVKFRNNPQHLRILVNEWIASVFLRYLEISTLATGMVDLTAEFLAANTDMYLPLGSRRLAVEPGWHFGSLSGDPAKVMLYGFIPEGIPGGDGVRQMDRQRRRTAGHPLPGAAAAKVRFRGSRTLGPGFLAHMMDHGYIFDGPHWTFSDSPLQGLYFRPLVHRNARCWDDFQPWLDRIGRSGAETAPTWVAFRRRVRAREAAGEIDGSP